MQTVDAVVVGAGLSGLQAALDLHEAGLSVLILEARDRIGGKTWSRQRPDGKGIQEIGAAWLNDTNQSMIWSYCQRFNLSTVVQNIEGSVVCEDENGECHFFPFNELPKFGEGDVQNITQTRSKVETTSLDAETFQQPKRAELDGMTFEQWLRKAGANDRALLTARVWSRGTLGQDPGEISALSFFEVARGALGVVNLRYDGKHGAQHLRLREGTQSISTGISTLLPHGSIKLNSPVRSIVATSSDVYTVETASGQTVTARKVIISIPSPAYRNITFQPPIPPHRQLYTNTVRYGCYVKFLCWFKSPFWRRQGACGLVQSFRGPVNHCRDTSVDVDDNYALTCFIASIPGRKWLALEKDNRCDAILQQLGSLFGVGYDVVKLEYLGSFESEWHADQWTGWGCPFPVPPPGAIGHRDDGELIRESINGLYFVGTELTNEWRGYMEGALRSGKRGAEQVLVDFRSR